MSRAELLALIAGDDALTRLRDDVEGRLDDDPGHDLAHALRVARWAVVIGEPLGVDPREAVAAALLHDVVNVPKDSPDRHLASERSEAVARAELPAYGFDAEAVERVAGAVRDHSFTRGAVPETPLGRALQDADRLEALGALGLFRCISTGGRMGARYFDDDDPFARSRCARRPGVLGRPLLREAAAAAGHDAHRGGSGRGASTRGLPGADARAAGGGARRAPAVDLA